MKVRLKRQTTWGCIRHFNIYKNGRYQGKLFNNIVLDLEVSEGDQLEFKDGICSIPKKIHVTSDIKEITITTTKNISHLFSAFLLLFLALSLLAFPLYSLTLFMLAEILIFSLLSTIFRYRSYEFSIANTPQPVKTFFKQKAPLKSL